MAGARLVSAANPNYDPYADALISSTNLKDPTDAVGSPDGEGADYEDAGSFVTLDMGQFEEGTQTLKIYINKVKAPSILQISFLNKHKNTLKSSTLSLSKNQQPATYNIGYNWKSFGQAYRYVKIYMADKGHVYPDAVQALGYLGSSASQDTDSDGITDRQEQKNDTDPLVPKSSSQSQVSPPPDSGATNNNSTQVSSPPKTDQDKDNDGIRDTFENANGLDSKDASDADSDADSDGLSNLLEFTISSDPQDEDSDGDGLPDKWEYDNGLDINKNDAAGDPDGDHLTNLGEYRYSTNPNIADDLYQVFARKCMWLSGLDWFWIIILLAAILLTLLAIFASNRDEDGRSRWQRLRRRLRKKL